MRPPIVAEVPVVSTVARNGVPATRYAATGALPFGEGAIQVTEARPGPLTTACTCCGGPGLASTGTDVVELVEVVGVVVADVVVVEVVVAGTVVVARAVVVAGAVVVARTVVEVVVVTTTVGLVDDVELGEVVELAPVVVEADDVVVWARARSPITSAPSDPTTQIDALRAQFLVVECVERVCDAIHIARSAGVSCPCARCSRLMIAP